MRVGVVISTYQWPEALELVLTGYAAQQRPADEILIADDGSGPETEALIQRMAKKTGLPLVHIWHSDRGFQKTEALNRAIRETRCDYLIFTDGDCVPRSDFVQRHTELARPGAFLSGGYLKLSEATTGVLAPDDVSTGRAFDAGWLASHGTPLGRHRLRLLPVGVRTRLLDRITPTKASWNGMSSSTWTDELMAANGFDLEFRYGGLDRELGLRLRNRGLQGLQVRHRAVVLHLHHDRPWKDPAQVQLQKEARAQVAESGLQRAARGLDELDDTVEVRITRYGPAGDAG